MRKINKKLFYAYCRQLGLASVIGSFSGLFLKPHHNISIISIIVLLLIGFGISYFGVCERRDDHAS